METFGQLNTGFTCISYFAKAEALLGHKSRTHSDVLKFFDDAAVFAVHCVPQRCRLRGITFTLVPTSNYFSLKVVAEGAPILFGDYGLDG